MERRLFQKSPEPSEGQSLRQGRGRAVQREEVSSGDVKEVELAKKMVVFFPKPSAALLQCIFHCGCCVRMLCVVLMLKLQQVLKFSQPPS